ncbi:MAG: sulfatase-like hydrolase/transferase, partial [Planctomycetes bacterium]|nr:sulfatase-like hydrolase/transferase [Planctomycetota bacterium]
KYTAEAIRFITENKDRPFFLYLAHNMPHVPLGASKDFRGKSKRGLYGDVIQELDWSAGQVLDTLKELGLDENTLVVYTSDNGPWVEQQLAGEGGIHTNYGSADPLRGWKMTTWEGGPRVPCIMRWPGKIPEGRVSSEMLTSMDLLPTFARLAGAKLPDDRTIDGHDVFPVISGETDAENPRKVYYFYSYNHLQAVRQGNWKLVLPRPARPAWCSWAARMTTAVAELELYDLAADVAEEDNVAGEHPEVVAELMKLVEEARDELGDYDRVGSGARFFDEGTHRPDALRWEKPKPADGGGPYPRSFSYTTAIGPEKGVTRRDPSDVIRAGEKFFVWYSKVTDGPGVWGYNSGYSADIYYASSADGKTWTEGGLAVGKGEKGDWDVHGVFTPNILVADKKFYLFYTGVPSPFDENTKTAIGLAVSDSPDGPWTRSDVNPILIASDDPAEFDSMRVDDAAFIARGGKYYFHYKGRQLKHTPGETKMGVAIADKPEGPYRKHDASPLHPGHEVMVWPHGEGVASLASAAGPRQIYFAADGLDFQPRNVVAGVPRAPGCFRDDNFREGHVGQGITWGISHASAGRDLYLVRFDCRFTRVAAPAPRGRGPIRPVAYDNAKPVGALRFDFESGDLQGWKVVEGEFDLVVSDLKSLPRWTDVPYNKQGKYHLSTVECSDGADGNDRMTGVLQSPEFTLTGKAMSFLVGGGNHDDTYVALCTPDGKELLRTGGTNSPVLRRVRWDVAPYVGQKVMLRIVDRRTQQWAHITFDDFSCEGEIP